MVLYRERKPEGKLFKQIVAANRITTFNIFFCDLDFMTVFITCCELYLCNMINQMYYFRFYSLFNV